MSLPLLRTGGDAMASPTSSPFLRRSNAAGDEGGLEICRPRVSVSANLGRPRFADVAFVLLDCEREGLEYATVCLTEDTFDFFTATHRAAGEYSLTCVSAPVTARLTLVLRGRTSVTSRTTLMALPLGPIGRTIALISSDDDDPEVAVELDSSVPVSCSEDRTAEEPLLAIAASDD